MSSNTDEKDLTMDDNPFNKFSVDDVNAAAKGLLQVTEVEVDGQQVNNGVRYPLVIAATSAFNASASLESSKGAEHSLEDVLAWVTAAKDALCKLMAKHGAIMFQSLGPKDADEFNQFLSQFQFDFLPDTYGGGGPRINVVGPIFTSTESPPELIIPFHHELSYISNYPTALMFFCETTAPEGGQTPICLSNRLFHRIKERCPEFVDAIKEKKVRYTRWIKDKKDIAKAGEQRSWQEVFDTDDRKVAEERAAYSGHETVEWLDDGRVKVVSQPFDGIVYDERTGVPTWFNSIVLLHPLAHKDLENPPWLPTFGDLSEFPDEWIEAAMEVMDEEKVAIDWHDGDALWVDNGLSLHGRNPFSGPRRVLTSMICSPISTPEALAE